MTSPAPDFTRAVRSEEGAIELGAFDFERRGGERRRRLAALVEPNDACDADALAARVFCQPPIDEGATVWRGIRAIRRPLPTDASSGEIDRREPANEVEAARDLRDVLQRAVDRALEGTKRVAVMTGGGVDSSALLALACDWARRAGGSAFAVALDFGGEGDDRPHLRALEAHLGCEVLRVRPEDAGSLIGLVHDGVDAMPFAWPGGPMEVEALARAKANGADCTLAGAGADLLFDGDPHSLARVMRRGRVVDAWSKARRLRGFAAPRSRTFSWLVRPLVADLVPVSLRIARAKGRAVAPDWAGDTLRRFVVADWTRYVEHAFRRGHDGPTRFEAAVHGTERATIAWYRHQHEIGAGIPRRDPYLDAELVRFVTSLRPEWLLHGAIRRGLFREAIRGLVPESLRTRETKAGFEEAFTRFVEGAGGFQSLRDLADGKRLAELGIVEPRAFRRAFDELARAPLASWGWGDVWPAITVEAFLRRRFEARS